MDTTQRLPSSETRQPAFLRHDVALLLARGAAALPLFFHGAQKLLGWFGGSGITGFAAHLASLGVPVPTLSAVLAAVSEVGGAAILATGRGFRGLPIVIFTMIVAAATSLRNGFDVQHGGAEYPLTLAVLLAAIALTGPGALVVSRIGAGVRR